MDYKAFYSDVEIWIQQANQAAMKYGMDNSDFWAWVAESASKICSRYGNNRLVIKQMMMLSEWLEEVYESRKTK